MKDSMMSRDFLFIVSISLLVVLFLGGNLKKEKNVEDINPYSSIGSVQIYNDQNALIGKFETPSIISFISNLRLKNIQITNEFRSDKPNYIIKIQNKELNLLKANSSSVVSIIVYDDIVYIGMFGLTYKANSNLSNKMIDRYNLAELKMPEANPKYGNMRIVELASQQLGNAGGEKFWSWYEIYNHVGFYRRMEWCCVFISWLGYQTGYLQAGEIPMFPNVSTGVAFYKARGKWQGKHYVPSPGDVIFFDLMLDDRAYHVGMVETVENGRVYTIEGNYKDAVHRRSYPIGSPYIYGYGTPNYKIQKPVYLK